MHDLDAVVIRQMRLRPVGAAHDFAVEFDGDSFGRELKARDEFAEADFVRQLLSFPVDV